MKPELMLTEKAAFIAPLDGQISHLLSKGTAPLSLGLLVAGVALLMNSSDFGLIAGLGSVGLGAAVFFTGSYFWGLRERDLLRSDPKHPAPQPTESEAIVAAERAPSNPEAPLAPPVPLPVDLAADLPVGPGPAPVRPIRARRP